MVQRVIPILIMVACLWHAQVAAAQPAAGQTILELDDWWNFDFAKNSCGRVDNYMRENNDPMAVACAGDVVAEVQRFEDALVTELAANPYCKGVYVTRYAGPHAKEQPTYAADRPRWSLSLNFIPGETRQTWEMLSPKPGRQYTTGSGTPVEIAAKLCVIVTGQGAQQAR